MKGIESEAAVPSSFKSQFYVLFFLWSIAVWFEKCIWQKQQLPLMEAGPCCLPAWHAAPLPTSTPEHPPWDKLLKRPLCALGVWGLHQTLHRSLIWGTIQHVEANSHRPCSPWDLPCNPAAVLCLDVSLGAKHLLPSSKLQAILPHGCHCAEPPLRKLSGSQYHYWGRGVRLGEAEDLLSFESSGGFPYAV